MSEINKIFKIIGLLMFILLNYNIYSSPSEKKDYLLLLDRQYEGVFIYNLNEKTETKIFELKKEGEGINVNKVRIIDNNLYFSIYDRSDWLVKERVLKWKGGFCFENEYLVNLKTLETYQLKKIKVEMKEKTPPYVIVTETAYSQKGECENVKKYETNVLPCFLTEGILTEPHQSKIVNGVQIISRQGDLYISSAKGEELLLKHRKDFSGELQLIGYCCPDLSNDGKKVIFCDFHYKDIGLWGKIKKHFVGKGKSYLIELDLKTMKQKVFEIAEDFVYYPKYSQSGKLILFRSSITPRARFYIFNLETKRMMRIPSYCHHVCWIK